MFERERRILTHLIPALLVATLVSCGNDHTQSSERSSEPTYSIYVTDGATTGKNAAAAVIGSQGGLSEVQWTQTGGTPVKLLSDQAQTISFDPPQEDTYSFSVAFTDASGGTHNLDATIPVTGSLPATCLNLRVSQSVRVGGNVSVRAWPTLLTGDSIRSISWEQLEGPPVTLDSSDSYRALFVAPSVSKDTVIRLRATMLTALGYMDSDQAIVVVEPYAQAPASDPWAVWADSYVSRVHPYVRNGPYANVLVKSVYDASLHYGSNSNLARLWTLPYLAQESNWGIPTVAQVMNHVLVSHDWIGKNFETFLSTQDTQGDFRRLLNGVTAVVLGTEIRPSLFHPLTGAIYLDANNFWLTPEERDTINEAPDFRSNFGATLNFTVPWRYVRGNSYLFQNYDHRARVSRPTSVLLDEAGWLLYHELGHAADFLPPSQYASLDSSKSPWENVAPRYGAHQLTSDLISAHYPLNSTIMAYLGQVLFQGRAASAMQRAYTPAEVGAFFAPDLATDTYNYSTIHEDTAMTFEEFMMITRLGIRRDVAIADQITPTTTNATWYVRWGQRGRIGEAQINPRLKAILQNLAPWVQLSTADNLPAPIAMRPGDTWVGNLLLSAPPSGAARAPFLNEAAQDARAPQFFLRRHAEVKLPPR